MGMVIHTRTHGIFEARFNRLDHAHLVAYLTKENAYLWHTLQLVDLNDG